MDDYDDFDEMYADEYEAMLEMEGDMDAKQNTPKETSSINTQPKTYGSEDLFQSQTTTINQNETTISNTESADITQHPKRTLEDLFGDIDDILAESQYINAPVAKKTKKDPKEENLQLIDRILQLREASKYQLNSINGNKDAFALQLGNIYDLEYSVSFEKPRWPCVGVERFDGRRMYVRYHNRDFEEQELRRIQGRCDFETVGVSQGFKNMWNEAQDIIKFQEEATQQENNQTILTPSEISLLDSKSLWVEKYKPKRYLELLSDESTNRILLRWLKLWDKVVFNKRPKIKPVVQAAQQFQGVKSKYPNFKKFERQDVALKLDQDGRPEFKVALLCGPPGLGKTTLAHLVARHAGYNPVEVNASDDRSVESFRATLERGTQMRSVLDHDNRPNCIVFDEIDGAPPSSIEFLIKYINGSYKGGKGKASKGAKEKKAKVLKRPIICICNDMYVPALRPLRQISFLVNFPPTETIRLAERLLEISANQTIETNLTALLVLSEKSNNDIRSCLSVLQFFRAQNKPVRLEDVIKTSVGLKDIQKSLFNIWKDVFQIQRPKNRDKFQEITALSRMQYVLSSILAFGDYDRVMHGIFENYPNMKVKGRCVPNICSSLEWFSCFDLTNKRMMQTQNYSLNAYLPFAFVVWHFTFASFAWQKLQYPSTDYEVRTKQLRNAALLSEIAKGTQPCLKPYVHKKNLSLEILPYLSHIIFPSFRPVNIHLYTDKEKQRLHDIIGKMIDYNISYIQERTVEGEYVYNMDPNIADITEFSSILKNAPKVSYLNKQLISREIQIENMRRAIDFKTRENCDAKNKNLEENKTKNKENVGKLCRNEDKAVPNHLQRLRVVKNTKNITPIVEKDIFGNVVQISKSTKVRTEIINDICFHYNEGFTNAVRRPILMKDLI